MVYMAHEFKEKEAWKLQHKMWVLQSNLSKRL